MSNLRVKNRTKFQNRNKGKTEKLSSNVKGVEGKVVTNAINFLFSDNSYCYPFENSDEMCIQTGLENLFSLESIGIKIVLKIFQ